MSRLTALGRSLLLFVFLGVPFGSVGFLIRGREGAIGGLACLAALLLVALLRCERSLCRAYRATEAGTEGVVRSMERALEGRSWALPRVRIFSDPVPAAWVARGWPGAGTVALSEGLLGVLNEEELRVLLFACVERSRSPGILLRSVCAWMAHRILALAPSPWLELLCGERAWHERLGAVNGLMFLGLYSASKTLLFFGRQAKGERRSRFAPHALLPYFKFASLPGALVNPGSGLLHVVDPWSTRLLFPL